MFAFEQFALSQQVNVADSFEGLFKLRLGSRADTCVNHKPQFALHTGQFRFTSIQRARCAQSRHRNQPTCGGDLQPLRFLLLLVRHLLLEAMHLFLVASLLLVVRPFAPSSVPAPSKARSP